MRAISHIMILLLIAVLTAPVFAAPLQVKLATLDKALEQAQTTAQRERVLTKDVSDSLVKRLLQDHPQAKVIFNAGQIAKQTMVSCDRDNTEETSYYIIVMEQNRTHYYHHYYLNENNSFFVANRLNKLQTVEETNWISNPQQGYEKAQQTAMHIVQLTKRVAATYAFFGNNILALAQVYPLNRITGISDVKVEQKIDRQGDYNPYVEIISLSISLTNGTSARHRFADAFPYNHNLYDTEIYHFIRPL